MKRTTIFIDEALERELKAIARRHRRPVARLVREAVERYVISARREHAPRLRFIGAGRSGRDDVAERHEELLFESGPASPGPAKPRSSTRRGARRTTRRHD